MAAKGNAAKNVVLDYMLGGAAYPTLYLALYTSAPTATGGGTEVSGNGYSRVAITNNATNWPAASNGSKSNGASITFPTATGDWGTIVATALHSHITNDTPVYFGAQTPKAVPSGAKVSFAVGSYTITEA